MSRYSVPPCVTPRPGEKVIYYRSEVRFEGFFHGYNAHDQLLVRNDAGGITPLDDFIKVRLADPETRHGGCCTDLSEAACIENASVEQKEKLDNLLRRYIRPGPRYIDLIEEIWARGYEVFLVGGSVRDVLNGDNPNDVDLVTTMPFFFLSSIAESMFGADGFSRHRNNGFMSIGKNAGNSAGKKETLIDVKNFFSHAPGTESAEFGANLELDQKLRDFACNAIYYDPIHGCFVDPSGVGIEDAKNKTLNLVNDPELSHPINRKSHITMRMFKFMHRGYTPSQECLEQIRDVYLPMMEGSGSIEVKSLFFRSILNKAPDDKKAELFWRTKQIMQEYGFIEIWEKYLDELEIKFGGR